MAHDPYSPCLCGSGKKLKFCCQDILADMIRVEKLIENQPDAAEKLLRQLLDKHNDKEVLVTQLASLLTRRGEFQEARTQLVNFLQNNTDEPRALLALADVCLTTDGFGPSRRIIHRAFQLGLKQYPGGVAMLASRIASHMAAMGCAMAVREHLALAVRLAPGDRRNQMLMQLAQFEGQKTIPYPFRGRFALLPVEIDDEALAAEELRARRVSQIGCWEPASILYKRILEQRPNDGALWYNLGLFHAWDGQIVDAATALHRAGELIEDHDAAVDAEALAQLLDLETDDDAYGIVQETIPVESVSELLTKLDDAAKFARVKSGEEETTPSGGRVAAEYEFLSEELKDPASADTLPDVVADITIVDADGDGETGPHALVVALEGDVDEAAAAFRELAGSLAKEADEDAKPEQLSRMPAPCRLFDWKIHQTEALGSSHFRDLDRKRLNEALEKWLETPLSSLEKATPMDAAKDDANKVKVAGSVVVLDVTCNRMGYDPDLSAVREKLSLAEPGSTSPAENESVTSLPLLQLIRLDASSLSDEQVIEFTNRFALVRHLRLMETALNELVKRPAALEKFSPMRAHLLRATVAREKNDLDGASACFEAARIAVADDADAFRTKLEIDIRELSCRLDNPQDPQLLELLTGIRDRYFVKIPEIEEVIREELVNSGCSHLLDKLEPATASAGSGEGLWTPGSDKPAGGEGEKKLWVPD